MSDIIERSSHWLKTSYPEPGDDVNAAVPIVHGLLAELDRLLAELAADKMDCEILRAELAAQDARIADAKQDRADVRSSLRETEEELAAMALDLTAANARIAELEAKTSEQERWQELHSEVWKESTGVLLEWRDKATRAERAEAEIERLNNDITAKAHNMRYMHDRFERAEAERDAMRAALEAVMGEWREGYGLRCYEQVRAALAPPPAGREG